MIRRTGQVLGLLAMLVFLCLLMLQVLPSSWLARQASAAGSAWSGMPVTIEDLVITSFSQTPGATFSRLTIAASPDAARLHADELTVRLSLPALLRGEFVLDRLYIKDGRLDAMIDEQGLGNWQTSGAGESASVGSFLTSLADTKIDDLVLDSFTVNLHNAQLDTAFSLDIEGVASTHDATRMSRGQIRGMADGQAVKLDAEFGFLGDVLRLPANGGAPISFDFSAKVGEDQLSLKGSVAKPDSLRSVDTVFSIRIASLRNWQAFALKPLPDVPSFSLAGALTRGNEDWLLQSVDGRIGSSDFSGDIRADSSKQPIVLDARLVSATLAVDELMQLPLTQWMPLAVHGSVDYRAEQVVSDTWPLDSIDLSGVLDGQRLSVQINRIGLRGGELDGQITRDLRSQPVITRMDLTLKRLDLQRLLPHSKDAHPRAGQMAAQVELSVAGETAASMRSSIEGTLVSLMTGDWLDTVLDNTLGVELARSLMVDRRAPVNSHRQCAYLELQAAEGFLQLRSLVFDTETIVYLGDGEFDWKNESIDLNIEPHPKKVGEDAHAIHVSGALSDPRVESVHPFLTRDSAISLLDATISPAVALMPFLNTYSDGSAVVCQGLASALDDP